MEALTLTFVNLFIFLFGASIGSFLNVVVYRLPLGISLMYPPSRCPKCGHKLTISENIPVIGWLWLKGRCRCCKTLISPRYPIVEALTGLIFLLAFWQFGMTNWQIIAYWTFLSWLLTLSLIDFDTMTLPNPLTKSGLVLGLTFHLILGWQTGTSTSIINHLIFSLSAAVLGIWLLDSLAFLGLVLFGKESMGAGDAKLMAMIGSWLGWKLLLLSGFLGCAMAAFAGGSAIALGWLKREEPMPFGPFLGMGAFISLFWGEKIISTYLKLFFP